MADMTIVESCCYEYLLSRSQVSLYILSADVTFANFFQGEDITCFANQTSYGISNNQKSADVQHPHYFSKVNWMASVDESAKFHTYFPDPTWVSATECGTFSSVAVHFL